MQPTETIKIEMQITFDIPQGIIATIALLPSIQKNILLKNNQCFIRDKEITKLVVFNQNLTSTFKLQKGDEIASLITLNEETETFDIDYIKNT